MAIPLRNISSHDGSRGYALLALLIVLALMGLFAVESVRLGAISERRAAEKQLIVVGLEYRRAISSYVGSTPIGAYPYPRSTADLLRDPRFPENKRYLRAAYFDPMTNSPHWGIIPAPGGGIAGVFSLSNEHPIQSADFPESLKYFEDADSYRQWFFTVLDVNATRTSLNISDHESSSVAAESTPLFSPTERNVAQ